MTRQALAERATHGCIPLGMHFELTKRCNLGCYHCYVVPQEDELSTTRWLGLVDEVAAAGCLSVTLTGGEVGMRDDWLTIAQAVRRARMMVSVFTNGTLLDDRAMDALAALIPVVVSVSLYGSDAASHDAVTMVPGSFEQTMRSVVGLRRRDVRCRVTTVLMKETFSSYPAIKKLAEDLGCFFSFDYTVSPRENGDCGPTCHRIDDDQLRELIAGADGPLEGVEAEAGLPVDQTVVGRAGACNAGRSRGWIGADGHLLPCMGLPPFGSVRTRSFAEVWNGPTATDLRRRLATPEGRCVDCALAHWCTTWCPRLAMQEDGDLSAEWGRACRIAELVREHWDSLQENADVPMQVRR